MRIALDYDKTFTADPDLWRVFVAAAVSRGHEVLCVTMRRPSEPIEMPCPVHYTSRGNKWDYCAARGIQIDIWIDDSPFWILNDAAA